MQLLNVDFTVVVSKAEECEATHYTPHEICQLNAHRKARAVAKHHPDALVIGADTEVALDTQIFGKPENKKKAEEMLLRLQSKTHEVVTGVCILQLRNHQERLFTVSTRVKFHPLTLKEIKEYLERIDPLDKAGAYAIQEHGELLVESINGSLTNVVGLPVESLSEELGRW
ncbi:MAG: maf [Verrucomicrobia bacterium]|jgi:septum formation protein|nr:maf [Verrucomicrobiota bacterium]